MPSGHTITAWSATSYVRINSERYQYLSIPLYATAVITCYSRVIGKKHSVSQVIASVLT